MEFSLKLCLRVLNGQLLYRLVNVVVCVNCVQIQSLPTLNLQDAMLLFCFKKIFYISRKASYRIKAKNENKAYYNQIFEQCVRKEV